MSGVQTPVVSRVSLPPETTVFGEYDFSEIRLETREKFHLSDERRFHTLFRCFLNEYTSITVINSLATIFWIRGLSCTLVSDEFLKGAPLAKLLVISEKLLFQIRVQKL